MLTGIEIYNTNGSLVLTLPVAAPDPSVPYVVTNIEGLGPVKADITTSAFASQDGGLIQASRTGMRNIVMSVGYRPDYLLNQSVQTLRRELYPYFSPKGAVRLRFLNDDGPTVEISGVVESHDPILFTQEPEVQISIMCALPNFKAITETVLNGFNNVPMPVSHFGTGDSGFVYRLFVNRAIPLIKLQNEIDDDISYGTDLVNGDQVIISTVRGNKYVSLIRGGVTTNDLDGIIAGSLDMSIGPLSGDFNSAVTGASTVPFSLTFTPSFIGL